MRRAHTVMTTRDRRSSRGSARRWSILASVAAAVAATTGCEPPPPAPVLVVTSDATGGDAVPGDGICETESGGGSCTLQAAFDEAEGLGRAAITMPPGQYPALDATITGDVAVTVDTAEDTMFGLVDGGDVEVAAGAKLTLRSVQFSGSGLLVWGSLHADRTMLVGGATALRVFPGGSAHLHNSYVGASTAIANWGGMVLTSSTVQGWSSDGVLVTAPGGTTILSATAILDTPGRPRPPELCSGAPRSMGHNLATDSSCALAGPGDIEGDPLGGSEIHPSATSRRVDAIPLGEAGCGTDLVVDLRGVERPRDGDGDGLAACDIGAFERLAP